MSIKYEIDPYNRLIRVKKFRHVINGRFKIDRKNRLYYEIFKSSKTDIPQKIKFSGTYSIDKDHNLIYTLTKWNNQIQGNRLRIRTRFIDASKNEIVFLSSFKKSNKKYLYTIKLHGAWQQDKNNRLTFGVKKEHQEKRDIITFFNAWAINKHSEIIYKYGHGRNKETITLKGKWYIKDKYRLSYILDKRIHSGFNFKISLGQIIPKGKKTYIKFDITQVLSKTKRITRRIVFSGKLRMRKKGVILLEHSIGKKTRTTLKFTKAILGQKGFAYIEAYLKNKEKYLGGGIGFRW